MFFWHLQLIIISSNFNTADHGLFNPVWRTLCINFIQITLHSRSNPVTCLDRRACFLVLASPQAKSLQERTVQCLKIQIVAWSQEIQQSKTIEVGLIRWRRNNSMDTRLQIPIRPELENVCDIHRDRFGVRLDIISASSQSFRPVSLTLTHFHCPSDVRICNAAIGCLNSSVRLPKSL